MPTPTPTAYVVDDPMDPTQVMADIASVRDYLNGGVVRNDVLDAGLGVELFARPVYVAVPFDGFDGEFQGLLFRAAGMGDQGGPQNSWYADERYTPTATKLLASERERRSIWPQASLPTGPTPVPGLVLRFTVDDDGVAEVLATAKLEAIIDTLTADTYAAGKVRLWYQTVDVDADPTAIEGTAKRLIVQVSAVAGNEIQQSTMYVTSGSFDVVGGSTYDVFVGYETDTAVATVRQVVVSTPVIGVEVHLEG